jgi:hypothetical protein
MSDALKLEIPLGGLHRKAKSSIVNSFQLFNNDKTILNKIQLIANRFIIVKRLGSGGFGEVYSSHYFLNKL